MIPSDWYFWTWRPQYVVDCEALWMTLGFQWHATDVLGEAASLDQYVYKAGKNCILAHGFAKVRPLVLQGSRVDFVDSHVQLGVSLGAQFDGRAHLQCILSRGPSKMHMLLTELSSAGFPMHALLLAFRTRLLPSASHAIELTVQVPFFEKQVNGLQASLLKKILRCYAVLRVVLMHELGVLDRLSATAWSRAIMVRRRARNDARYSSENEILRLAENEPSSWSASVLRKEQQLGLPELGIDTSVLSVKQIKAKLHYHAVTVVLPAVRAHEQANWHSCSKNIQHWLSYSKLSWTVHQLADLGIRISDAQAWAQLKLQGYFSHAALGPAAPCRFCSSNLLEDIEHLFFDCDVAMQIMCNVPDWGCADARRSVGSNLTDAWSVTRWVRASGELLRHLDKR